MAKFKENTNMFHIGTMDAPMIKGHACIELKDVRTGKRERIEHDNTFMATTLAKYMRSLGAANNSPYANASWRNLNKAIAYCGGIFLFKDAITEGSEYMEAGNKMIANGSYNVTNGGQPAELGSWNSIESSIDGNSSVVLVWDWNTAQGNGQISSVCLTSNVGGYIGYGNASGNATSSKWNFSDYQSTSGLDMAKLAMDNHRYVFTYANPILTVQKYKYPIDKATIFDGTLEETLTFDLSEYGYNWGGYDMSYRPVDEKGRVMIMSGDNSWDNNTPMKFYIFDPEDDSLELHSVMNTTGYRVYDYYNSEAPIIYFKDDDLLFVQGYGFETLFVCDGTTGAVRKTFNIGRDDYKTYTKFSDDLFFVDAISKVLDLANNTYLPTNANDTSHVPVQYLKDDDILCKCLGWQQSSTADAYICKNPLYLATINNLQESVTKQNTQTMKVTYTLTEV